MEMMGGRNEGGERLVYPAGEEQWCCEDNLTRGSIPTPLQKLGQLHNLFEAYFQGVLYGN